MMELLLFNLANFIYCTVHCMVWGMFQTMQWTVRHVSKPCNELWGMFQTMQWTVRHVSKPCSELWGIFQTMQWTVRHVSKPCNELCTRANSLNICNTDMMRWCLGTRKRAGPEGDYLCCLKASKPFLSWWGGNLSHQPANIKAWEKPALQFNATTASSFITEWKQQWNTFVILRDLDVQQYEMKCMCKFFKQRKACI